MVFFRSLKVFSLSLFALGLLACSSDPETSDDSNAPQADASVAGAADADLTQPDAMPSATLGFMDACDLANDQCDTAAGDLCFSFNTAGPHCTHTCTGADDCPAPSRGCNNMGVCKSP